METELEKLKRAYNYSSDNKELIITHSNKSGKYCNQYRIEWFDYDGDNWLLVRLSGLKRYKRIKKENIKNQVVLIDYTEREMVQHAW